MSEVETAQSFIGILPDLTPTVVALLLLGAGFYIFLKEIKEREKAMRSLEKDVRDRILLQLDKNSDQLSENTRQLVKNTEMLASMVQKFISR